MSDEVQRLAILIEANTRQCENAVKRVEQKIDRSMRASASSIGRLDKALKSTTASAALLSRGVNVGKGLIGASAIGSVLSFTGALAKARDAIRDLDDIADQAAASGLGTDFYQGLSFGAKEAGASTEQLNGALATFAKNSGLAAEGKGRMVAQLKVLNPELLKGIQNAENQEERVRLLADALTNAASAENRAAIGSATLGDAWTQLLPVFARGADGIDRIIERARAMGIIVPPGLLERAGELEDKLNVLAQVVDAQLNTALIELAPLLVAGAQAVATFAEDIRNLADEPAIRFLILFNEELENGKGHGAAAALAWERLGHTQTALAASSKAAGAEIERLETSLARLTKRRDALLAAQARGEIVPAGAIEAAERGIAEVTLQLQALDGTLDGVGNSGVAAANRIAAAMYQSAAYIDELRRHLSHLPENQTRNGANPEPPKPPASDDNSGSGSGGGGSAADDAERQREAVDELVESLRFELEMIGKSEAEQRLANELRQAGTEATAAQRAEIEALVTAISAEEEAQARVAAAQQQLIERMDGLRDAAGQALSAFELRAREHGELRRGAEGGGARSPGHPRQDCRAGGHHGPARAGRLAPWRNRGGNFRRQQRSHNGNRRALGFAQSRPRAGRPDLPRHGYTSRRARAGAVHPEDARYDRVEFRAGPHGPRRQRVDADAFRPAERGSVDEAVDPGTARRSEGEHRAGSAEGYQAGRAAMIDHESAPSWTGGLRQSSARCIGGRERRRPWWRSWLSWRGAS